MSVPPLLSLDRVSKTYMRGPHELRVLRNVSLTVSPGDFVAIYGPVHSGKTTLLKIAAGVESADSGRVSFEGVDVASLSRRRLALLHRDRIGWVRRAGPRSQDLRTLDYVALPLLSLYGQAEAQQRGKRALDTVGAAACAFEPWGNLSDAERMAVAIAQGLAREPSLLLVDDPTAGLDVLERERVIALLRRAADDSRVAVVMAVPDLPALLRAHDVRSLSNGKLLSPDPPPRDRGVVLDFPRSSERSA